MSLAVLNVRPQDEVLPEQFGLLVDNRRRHIIKAKVIAIGRLSRTFTVLKTYPALIQELKTLSGNNKLPQGTLALGEQGIRQAITSFTSLNDKPAPLSEDNHPEDQGMMSIPNTRAIKNDVPQL
ncbi:uncharacterized protein BYT42DRAFT_609905 [Radiomyces spectabilis]|uniref:uncharacterized protein n=1 Tax=Radiomyces spectabilis TaxID=64574 RepID=UPI00221FC721|nr:uncharacterized protein BYT42DRAFT_609905 [Radiomyces spectabilis]KAI8394168.1 hypothetical protein BYT42DRAFT_609905 [Radiomyces spectabilis]